MRLQQYINEGNQEISESQFMEEIQKNCKPFFKDLGSVSFSPIYRGMKNKGKYFKSGVRKDRRPLDTPPILTKYIDNLFYKKFGWRPRTTGLFTTNDRGNAASFGSYIYRIYPVGNYKILYHKNISDLYEFADISIFKDEYKNHPYDINDAKILNNDGYVNHPKYEYGYSLFNLSLDMFGKRYQFLTEGEWIHLMDVYNTLLYNTIKEFKEIKVNDIPNNSFEMFELIIKCDSYYGELV